MRDHHMMPVQMDLAASRSPGAGDRWQRRHRPGHRASCWSAEGARVAIASRQPRARRPPDRRARRRGRPGHRRRAAQPRSPGRSRRWAAWTGSSTTSASPASRTLEEVDDADWQAAWDTNVMSYVRCIRAALPHLRDVRARRHRERLVDLRKAAQRRHARVLGDEGRAAVAVAAGGRRPRRRRHPLQRGHSRPDALAGLAGARRAGRPDRGRVRPRPRAGARVGGRRAGRWSAWPSQRRSRP